MNHLIIGQDEYRKNLLLKQLKEKILGKNVSALNFEQFHADKDFDISYLINSLDTPALTGSNKIVALKDCQYLKKEQKQCLAAYMKKFNCDKRVFILFGANFPIERDKLNLAISKFFKKTQLDYLNRDEQINWVETEFKFRGKTVTRKASEFIADYTAGDLQRALSVIEQVISYSGETVKILEEDVLKFCGAVSETSAFKILDYINNKNSADAIKILKGLFVSGTNPLQLIGLLNWHLSRIIVFKRMLINNLPQSEICSAMKISSYHFKRLLEQAKTFSVKQLTSCLEQIFNTDLKIKTTGIKDEFLLEMLVVKFSLLN